MKAFLLSVFVVSASFGFICLFHATRVQSETLRIFSKDQSTVSKVAKIIVESPLYIKTTRFVGVFAWIIALASWVVLMYVRRVAVGMR